MINDLTNPVAPIRIARRKGMNWGLSLIFCSPCADSEWCFELLVECGSFKREYRFASLGKALKAYDWFLSWMVMDLR